MPFASLAGRHLVVEEKLDGANAGICFDETGRLWLQSRGHWTDFDWNTGHDAEDYLSAQTGDIHLRLTIAGFEATSFGLVIQKAQN